MSKKQVQKSLVLDCYDWTRRKRTTCAYNLDVLMAERFSLYKMGAVYMVRLYGVGGLCSVMAGLIETVQNMLLLLIYCLSMAVLYSAY